LVVHLSILHGILERFQRTHVPALTWLLQRLI
jgi:hypothetical protein